MNDSLRQLHDVLNLDKGLRDASWRAHKKTALDWTDTTAQVTTAKSELAELIATLTAEVASLQGDLSIDPVRYILNSNLEKIKLLVLTLPRHFSSDTVDRLANEIQDFWNSVLDARGNEAILGAFLYYLNKLSSTCFDLFEERSDLEDRIALANLNCQALALISQIKSRAFDAPVPELSYNSFRSSLLVDRLRGFTKNSARMRTDVLDDLRFVGPLALENAENLLKSHHGTQKWTLPEVDDVLNLADTLTIYASYVQDETENWISTFSVAKSLYEITEVQLEQHPVRIPLVITRWARSFLYTGRRLLATHGRNASSQILSEIKQGTRVLGKITGGRGKYRDNVSDKLLAEALEIDFLDLSISSGLTSEKLLFSTRKAVLRFIEKYGNRYVASSVWNTLRKCYQFEAEPYATATDELAGLSNRFHTGVVAETSQKLLDILSERTSRDSLEEVTWRWTHVKDDHSSLNGFLTSFGGLELESRRKFLKFVERSDFDEFSLRAYLLEFIRFECCFAAAEASGFGAYEGAVDQICKSLKVHFGETQNFFVSGVTRYLVDDSTQNLTEAQLFLVSSLLDLGLNYSDDEYWVARSINVLRQRGMFDAALKRGEWAVSKFPRNSALVMQHSITLMKAGEPAAVLDNIQVFKRSNGIKLSALHPSLRSVYASSMSVTGNRIEALPIFKQIVRERPGDQLSRLRLGRLLFNEGRDEYSASMNEFAFALENSSVSNDMGTDRIARDAAFGIGQILKDFGRQDKELAYVAYEDLFGRLSDTTLITFLKAHEICGGFSPALLEISEHVRARKNLSVTRAYFGCVTGRIIEDTIHSRELPYLEGVYNLSLELGVENSLFGGSKGSYRRYLLRNTSNPLIESGLQRQISTADFSAEYLQPMFAVVRSEDMRASYYDEISHALSLIKQSTKTPWEDLAKVVLKTCKNFQDQVSKRTIRFEDWEPRVFDAISEKIVEGADRNHTLYADPDFVRFMLAGQAAGETRLRDRSVEFGISVSVENAAFRSAARKSAVSLDGSGGYYKTARVFQQGLI